MEVLVSGPGLENLLSSGQFTASLKSTAGSARELDLPLSLAVPHG